ncbi:uncharacterized protein BO87DRAFT_41737 [Aspergillus neoniger CBS 115656]|uniref:Uncharacterized protein n=1 Tax=Aspergillus neoniger (strain CBS 115656) TaxID=1448310 RepID=A0A318YKK3_ASPNB|nr:hypothetical protein BO87DRAFT_41737 [Aspergillus neoniger CBS 115656]PYH34766.1 hypothetical protein BO87DRAFT_41737 [Aspergillus neoniger CBS 115656]
MNIRGKYHDRSLSKRCSESSSSVTATGLWMPEAAIPTWEVLPSLKKPAPAKVKSQRRKKISLIDNLSILSTHEDLFHDQLIINLVIIILITILPFRNKHAGLVRGSPRILMPLHP